MDGQEIAFIVERLRLPPFELDIDLVSLDEKTSPELLDIFASVVSAIDKQTGSALSAEHSPDSALRVMELLSSLNFKSLLGAEEFISGILAASKVVIYPALVWLLKDVETFKKRAYLARYLRKIEIPEQFAAEPELLALQEEYLNAIASFKTTHKAIDSQRSSVVNVQELQKEIAALDMEKEQIANKIKSVQRRVEALEGSRCVRSNCFACCCNQRLSQRRQRFFRVTLVTLLPIVSNLRKANETKQNIAERLREQDGQLQQCRTRAKDLEKRLADMKDAARTGDPADILKRLEEGSPFSVKCLPLCVLLMVFSQMWRLCAIRAPRPFRRRSKQRKIGCIGYLSTYSHPCCRVTLFSQVRLTLDMAASEAALKEQQRSMCVSPRVQHRT
jgi:intraflagellar transport protein 81